MSPNLAVKRGFDPNSINVADFIFAALVHILVVLLIIILAWWRPEEIHKPEPMKRIEVQMISAADLKKIQQPKRKKGHQIKKKVTPKVKLKTKPKAKLESKKKVKLKRKEKLVVKDDFDPFAPLESTSNKEIVVKKNTQHIASKFSQQLSIQEKNRYIAMMQAAVQQHWKVPGGISNNTTKPMVEMTLRRDGSVANVRIIESSGDNALDQTLLNAIYAASPFDLPKQQFEAFRYNRIRFHAIK